MSDKMKAHLKARNFDLSLYKSVAITDETVTFPLWNMSGQMVGYQQYRPLGDKAERRNPKLGKYFTYVRKEDGFSAVTAWGLELLDPCKREVYLLEGVFKACRFHRYGLNALAALSNDPKHLRSWLNSLGYEIRPVCDGDEAGRKLAKYGKKPVILYRGAYIDEMAESEFCDLLNLQMKKPVDHCDEGA